MRITLPAAMAASLLTLALAAAPASARGGGGGGDREPAGGAFNSSYPEQGSTGIQKYGPPRSADIPRPPFYGYPETTGSIRRVPGSYPYGR